MKTTIAVNGACGRMGLRILQLAHQDKSLQIAAALEAAGHPRLGQDIGDIGGFGAIGVPVVSALPLEQRLDVLIDFSLPEGTQHVLRTCVERRIPVIVATTGHSAEQKKEIQAAAHHTAVLFSPNLSLSVNVLFQLAALAGKLLKGRDFDVEIVERHHRFKKDSPSGTAMQFARIIQENMGQTELRHGREGLVGQRPGHEIGMHAVRVGDNVGEHTIIFSALGETMELVHKAHSIDSYARGALHAAKFLAGRPAGLYEMKDVLGIG